MVTYARNVGRLVEIRLEGVHSFDRFARVIALANELGPDAKVVVCTDARRGQYLAREAEERWSTMIRSHAQRVLAAVILVDPESPLRRMVERVLGRVSHLGPRVALSVDEALAFLATQLNPAELARAKQFLAEGE